jgi:hypothetical protein
MPEVKNEWGTPLEIELNRQRLRTMKELYGNAADVHPDKIVAYKRNLEVSEDEKPRRNG